MLKTSKKHWIVVFVGPIGSGKGTQADLVAEDFGLVHLESSKVIEEKMARADENDSQMKREKENFKSGRLTTPRLVREWIMEKIRELAASGKGIVFSGSPRTVFEAEGELPLFEEFYGRENVRAIHLNISEEEAVNRNSNRRICSLNRHPIPNFPEFKEMTHCPKDGSELIRRVLDNTETTKVRYRTYLSETFPVLDYFRMRGYPILDINGEQSIEKVHDDIVRKLHEKHASKHKDILDQ